MTKIPKKPSINPRSYLEQKILYAEQSIQRAQELRYKTALEELNPIIYFTRTKQPSDEYFAGAKFLIRKAGLAYQVGEYPRANYLYNKTMELLTRDWEQFNRYRNRSAERGMKVAEFGKEFGDSLFKIGIVSAALAAAIPTAGGSVAALGTMECFKGWFVGSMGGAAAYGLASTGKRAVYQAVSGKKISVNSILNNKKVYADLENGLFLSSMLYFFPFAAAQGEAMASSLLGIRHEIVRLFPISILQGVHGGAEAMAKGSGPLETGIATALGLVIPYFFRFAETGFGLPRMIRQVRSRMHTRTVSDPAGAPTHPNENHPYRNGYTIEALNAQTPYQEAEYNGIKMIKHPGGLTSDGSHDFPHNPPHLVILKPFLASKTAVTQRMYRVKMAEGGARPAMQAEDALPKGETTFAEKLKFCEKTGTKLLTSAQSAALARGRYIRIKLRGEIVSPEEFAKKVEHLENFIIVKRGRIYLDSKIHRATDAELIEHLNRGGEVIAWRKYPTRSGHPDPSWEREGRRLAAAESGVTSETGATGWGNFWEQNQDWFKPIVIKEPTTRWGKIRLRFFGRKEAEGPDYYTPPTYDPQGPREAWNVLGQRVVRGGSFNDVDLRYFRSAYRLYGDHPDDRYYNRGFRVGAAAAAQD